MTFRYAFTSVKDAGKDLPIFVYYHGGGFFGGGPDIVEQMCMLLVQKLDCVALNVDYRFCPESHYPHPVDDCWAATRWAYENAEKLGADANKLAVRGDSAGGNLAAVISLKDRDEGTNMVKLQVLLYTLWSTLPASIRSFTTALTRVSTA